MPTFEVRMRVTYEETWTVEADSITDASELFDNCADSVITDDTGGEVIDWSRAGKVRKVDGED